MKTSHNTFLIIIFFIIVVSSCSTHQMNNVDFDSTDTKMYFIDIKSDYGNFDSCNFIEKYKNFYIDDLTLIQTFNKELRKDVSRMNYSNTSCYYVLQIIQKGEIKYGAYLDIKNKQLIESSNYKFDLDKFESFSDKYIKLDAYKINCNSLKQIKILASEFETSGAYIYEHEYFKENRIFDFNGVISLTCTDSNHGNLMEWDEIEKSIKKDFKNIDHVGIFSYSSTKSDSVKIDLFCTKDISKILPLGYQIVENYTDTINLPFRVYDLSEKEINKIIKKNNLRSIEIVDLNE